MHPAGRDLDDPGRGTRRGQQSVIAGPRRGPGYGHADFTNQILFLCDGSYLDDAATAAHLHGYTWGMMKRDRQLLPRASLWASLAVAVLVLVPIRNSTRTTPTIT